MRNIVRKVSGEDVLIDFGLSKIGNLSEKEKKREIVEAVEEMTLIMSNTARIAHLKTLS